MSHSRLISHGRSHITVRREEVFNGCISIMHGKLVLSPEYFNEAIFHSVVQTFSFLNEINRFLFCSIHRVVAMQRVREQHPFLALLSAL